MGSSPAGSHSEDSLFERIREGDAQALADYLSDTWQEEFKKVWTGR